MDRTAKAEVIAQLKSIFAEAGIVVIAQYRGLSVADLSALRERLKEQGAHLQVIKNRLAKIALGQENGEQAELFRGPVAIAWSGDPITAPKIVVEFARKQNKLLLAGALMNDGVLDETELRALAKLPSLDELRGKLIGLLQAPGGAVATTIAAPGAQLARLLSARLTQDQQA